jgi:tetratricopeptide (TPR) repeat protein
LDDDDVYYPWHIETLVGVLENIPGIEFVYSNTIKSEYVQRSDGQKSFCNKELVYRQQTSPKRMLQSNEITWLSVMHSRKVLDSVEGLDASLAALIDYDFWRRISSYFYLYHVDAVTAEYYLRNSKGDSGEGQITNLYTNDPVKYHWCDKVIKEKPLYPKSSALYKDEQREKQKAQAKYYVVKGDSYRATEKYEAAHTCYIKAQSVLADSYEILFRLGSNMMSMEQYGKALEYFKRLVEIEGNIDVDLALVVAQCAVLAAELAFSQNIIRKIDPAQLDESQRKVFLQLHRVALAKQQPVVSEVCSS